MGNSPNKNDLESLHKNWVTASQPQSSVFGHINLHRTRLLVNSVTLDYIQEYNIHFLSEQEFKEYLKQTKWRQGLEHRDPLAYIPPIRLFIDTSSSQLCARSHTASIYFDKIEMRLQQINDIPFTDAMYMMRICLEGFKILMEHFGLFCVGEDMIFINSQGEVKVWINPNLSSVQPFRDLGEDKDYSNSKGYNMNAHKAKIKNENTIKLTKGHGGSKSKTKSTIVNDQQNAGWQLSEQKMVKQIIALVEDNIDPQALLGNGRPMFSRFIKDYYDSPTTGRGQNISSELHGNLMSNSRQMNQVKNNKNSSGSQKFKPAGNNKLIFKFDNILELYNKYLQKYAIVPSMRMEVIYEIYKSKNGVKNVEFDKESRSSVKDIFKSGVISQQGKSSKIVYLNVNNSSQIETQNNLRDTWKNIGTTLNGRYDQSAVIDIKKQKQFNAHETSLNNSRFSQNNSFKGKEKERPSEKGKEKEKIKIRRMVTQGIEYGNNSNSISKHNPSQSITKNNSALIPPQVQMRIAPNAYVSLNGGKSFLSEQVHNSPQPNSRNNSIESRPALLKTIQGFPTANTQVLRTNKYQSPLSTLLEEQQGHRIVRTNNNNIQFYKQQRHSNDRNIKFNYKQLPVTNGAEHTSNKMQKLIGGYQSPKQDINTHSNGNPLNIKYVRTPYKSTQGEYQSNKPNSVNVLASQPNTNSNKHDHLSLNKATKIEKYIVNNHPSYFNQNSAQNHISHPVAPAQRNQRNTYQAPMNNTNHHNSNLPYHQNNFNHQRIPRPQHAYPPKQPKQANQERQIKYYTSNESYQLDSQIADDLQQICQQQY